MRNWFLILLLSGLIPLLHQGSTGGQSEPPHPAGILNHLSQSRVSAGGAAIVSGKFIPFSSQRLITNPGRLTAAGDHPPDGGGLAMPASGQTAGLNGSSEIVPSGQPRDRGSHAHFAHLFPFYHFW